jgi:hypothetical protein
MRVVVIKNIPADEVERTRTICMELGATNIELTENPDGTFDLEASFAD